MQERVSALTPHLFGLLNEDQPPTEPLDLPVSQPARHDNEQSESQPAYLRAQEEILRMIEGPDYSPGDKIPSERVLSEMFGLSRMTVRRSVEDLVRMGVLERRSTSGTHVATPSVIRPLDQGRAMSVSRMIEIAGAKPGSRLLFFESASASRTVASHLKIAVGAPLIVVKRLRTANGLPFCVETSYLPAERVPGLAATDLMGDVSLFALLEQRYGIRLGRRQGVISVAPILREEATLLGVEAGINVLFYRIDVHDEQDRPIEHMVSVNHPQRVSFSTSTSGATVSSA